MEKPKMEDFGITQTDINEREIANAKIHALKVKWSLRVICGIVIAGSVYVLAKEIIFRWDFSGFIWGFFFLLFFSSSILDLKSFPNLTL